MIIAARPLVLVERNEDPSGHRDACQTFLLGFRTITPMHTLRLAQLRDPGDPFANVRVDRVRVFEWVHVVHTAMLNRSRLRFFQTPGLILQKEAHNTNEQYL
jgi:hypothetical protein